MGRNKHHNSGNSEKETEEQPELSFEEETSPEKKTETSKIISSKQFVQKLRSELKGISESVLNAFVAITPKMDKEENYWEVWNSTFKRK